MANESKELQVQDVEKEEIVESEAERTRDRRAFVPRADIYETDDDIIVAVDMPGVDENSIDITLEKNVLTLNGYVDEEAPEGYSLAYAEYGVGDYQRSFTLSNQVDQNKIEASVKAGVLHLRLPKADVAKSKKITVKAG